MHVLQLGPVPPPEGGITRNIMAIRDELRCRGHSCSILATARSTHKREDADVYYPRNSIDLLRHLYRIEYDVLHLHIGGEIPPRVLALIALCGAISRGKSALTLHSGGYALEMNREASPWSIAGYAFRRYARLICVNKSMVEMFEKYGVNESRLRLIPPFFVKLPDGTVPVPDLMRQFAASHAPFLLTVGLLEDAYNLQMQIDCVEQIIEMLPNAGLMIVGSGSLEAELRHRIESKPYRNNILLAGDVPHEITIQLIEDCDILLRTTKFDGDAISIREALYLGRPVIATENGMRPEGVFLISNPVRGGELVEKVFSVYGNKSNWEASKAFDGSENINAVIHLYEEMLAS